MGQKSPSPTKRRAPTQLRNNKAQATKISSKSAQKITRKVSSRRTGNREAKEENNDDEDLNQNNEEEDHNSSFSTAEEDAETTDDDEEEEEEEEEEENEKADSRKRKNETVVTEQIRKSSRSQNNKTTNRQVQNIIAKNNIVTVRYEDAEAGKNDSDSDGNESKKSEKDNADDTSKVRFFKKLKRSEKYGDLSVAELANLSGHVRHNLFRKCKFVDDGMVGEFVDEFTSIHCSAYDAKELKSKRKNMSKLIKDTFNARRGYATQQIVEKMRGT